MIKFNHIKSSGVFQLHDTPWSNLGCPDTRTP